MRLLQLLRCRRGSAAVEFALVAPTFLTMLAGVEECCRLIWTNQVLSSVAFSTARCATYSSTCATTSAIQTYATQAAGSYGLTVAAANVAYTANTTCSSNPAQNKVTITYSFNSPFAGLIPRFPTTVTATGCFVA